ncbi:LamB/YcsF family protein [Glutamicibacter sp. MNS18]|uniref:5-oxoprolinase subunit PxpA n=1 Tax=Glutamicibacter sp. MNS18 TaxID=2989817 RepID=UPI00223632AE|nr:5-oxoprolinase subunit PxpA [Glutamicibacter sp. MNS18]MCW4465697.1 LamB/YcsF family protein [Glutamicibacter sp. MNS18]
MAMELDLNADIAESFGQWSMGDDDTVLKFASSANVACGFHAGDPKTIARACRAAVTAGVRIGAHAGYHDLRGFGRRALAVPPEHLRADLLYQLGAVNAVARGAGATIGYFKPHGALYRAVDQDALIARAVVDAVAAFDAGLVVLHRPGSLLLELAAQRGLATAGEIFAHRAYLPDGSLVPDGDPRAHISDPAQMIATALRLAEHGTLQAVDGTLVPSTAVSVRIQGDHAAAVSEALAAHGVKVRPFAR